MVRDGFSQREDGYREPNEEDSKEIIISTRVPNGRRKTRLDQLVQPKVKSSLMVEIRPTGQSGLLKLTQPGLVRPGPPSNRICYFYHYIT